MPWINRLTQEQGPNILRCKGIVADEGRPQALRLPGRAHDARRRARSANGSRTRSGNRRSCSSAATSTRRRSATASSPARLDAARCVPMSDAQADHLPHRSTSAPSTRARRSSRPPSSTATPALALADGVVLIGEPGCGAGASPPIPTARSCGRVATANAADRRRRRARRRHRRRRRARRDRRRKGPLDRRAGAAQATASPGAPARQVAGPRRDGRGADPGPRRRPCAASPSSRRAIVCAATHYNGASLWFPKVEGPPQTLEWKGAHLDATVLARRPLPRHLDAGERAARLAARRFAQHADDRLSGQDALAVLVARRRLARDLGRRGRRSSGRSRTRTGRWARRRANAACARRG